MKRKLKITRGSGYVFADIGFDKDEAENLKLRAELMMRIEDCCQKSGVAQAAMADTLGLTLARRLPVFNPQPENPAEFSRIVRDQYQVMGARDCSYQQVVGTDRLALRRQIRAYKSIVVRALIIEGDGSKRPEKVFQTFQVGLDACATPRAEEQFRPDDAAHNDVGRLASCKTLQHCFVGGVQQPDAGVCVKRVLHSRGCRSSGGPEGSWAIAAADDPLDIRLK